MSHCISRPRISMCACHLMVDHCADEEKENDNEHDEGGTGADASSVAAWYARAYMPACKRFKVTPVRALATSSLERVSLVHLALGDTQLEVRHHNERKKKKKKKGKNMGRETKSRFLISGTRGWGI